MAAAEAPLAQLQAWLALLRWDKPSGRLILLIPVVQKAVIALVGQRLAARGFRFDGKPPQNEVVEGEFTVVVEPRDDALPPSRWTRH